MSRSGRLFLIALSLASVGAATVALAVAVTASSVTVSAPAAGDLLEACGRFLLPALTPAGALVLGLAAFSTAVGARAVRSLWRQTAARRTYHCRLTTLGDAQIGGAAVRVLADARPQAFCSGYLRPRIYVSTGALELLRPPELDAVIAHERHHAARRDPLRLLSLRVLAEAFFFLPALRSLAHRYEALAEVAADQAALRIARRETLASALLTFGGTGHPQVVVGIAPERIDNLLGRAPGWSLPLTLFAASLAALVGVVAVALLAATLASGSSLELTMVLARSCMLVMLALPALVALVMAISRAGLRRRPTIV